RLIARGVELDDPLAAERGCSVFADGADRIVFACATAIDGREPVNVAGGEGNEMGGAIALGANGGDDGVHGPGRRRRVGGAEFLASHEDDVWGVGERRDGVTIEQIAGDRLD